MPGKSYIIGSPPIARDYAESTLHLTLNDWISVSTTADLRKMEGALSSSKVYTVTGCHKVLGYLSFCARRNIKILV